MVLTRPHHSSHLHDGRLYDQRSHVASSVCSGAIIVPSFLVSIIEDFFLYGEDWHSM
jgi:hypothetical protein